MNKRIYELKLEAAQWAKQNHQAVDPENLTKQEYEQRVLMMIDKFAELIVGECVDIGDNYQEILGNEPECFNCRKVAYGIVDKIKQHFGIEG